MYKAHGVPVGLDQVPHVEITREIARRFNYLYGKVFPEPEAVLTKTAKVLGWDRRKMSKSYNNAVYLSDSPEEIADKVSRFVTDPNRARRKDPGDPSICNVFSFHRMYTAAEKVAEIEQDCRRAGIGCVACKKLMAASLVEALAPIHEKRRYYEERPDELQDIMRTGTVASFDDRNWELPLWSGSRRVPLRNHLTVVMNVWPGSSFH